MAPLAPLATPMADTHLH